MREDSLKDGEKLPSLVGSPPDAGGASTAGSEETQAKPTGADDEVSPAAGYASADEALVRIRAEMPAIFERAAANVEKGDLPLIGWGLALPRVQKLAHEHENKPWFFIGDIHGDFLAWHRLFERVRQESDFRLCFLGDLVDRGPLDLECLAALLEAAENYPDQILWILGNHDEGLRFDAKSKEPFHSSVEPSEFATYLNEAQEGVTRELLVSWGRLFIEVCQRLPRAVLFADGLLATHGGVPLGDRWASLKTLEAFHHPRVLADFTWTRATQYPRKSGWKYDPGRRATSSAFEFGYEDLNDFCKAVEDVLPIKRMIRGHDHVEHGALVHARYQTIPVLTLNGFGFHYLDNSVANYRPKLVLGIAMPEQVPRVEEVDFQPEEHAAIYSPKESASVLAPPCEAEGGDSAP